MKEYWEIFPVNFKPGKKGKRKMCLHSIGELMRQTDKKKVGKD